jgi:hypothetical protein
VNVQTGSDAVSTLITDSFFLTADDAGNVLASNPALTRRY